VAVGREDHIDTSADLYQFYLPRLVLNWDADAGSSVHRRIDGTMVFVDISGFTAMSERLARFGKVGAEEVTEVLGGCFEGLLAVAYPLGGRLIKFGGDALLLLFDGDRHEGRAINAAVGEIFPAGMGRRRVRLIAPSRSRSDGVMAGWLPGCGSS